MDGSNLRGRALARSATQDDVPWIVELAKQCYPGYDFQYLARALEIAIRGGWPAVLICGGHVGVVWKQVELWRPNDPVADLGPVFGRTNSEDQGQLRRLHQKALDWAKENGCYILRWGSTVDLVNGDDGAGGLDLFAPFAKRYGGKDYGKTYYWDLRG